MTETLESKQYKIGKEQKGEKKKDPMKELCQVKLTRNEDFETLKVQDWKKIDHLHFDFTNNKVDKSKFIEIFSKISGNNLEKKFHLDFTNVELDDDRIEAMCKCMRNFTNLRNLHFHFKDTKFSDEQFDKFMCDCIASFKNLEKLHFEMENCNVNPKKIKFIENFIKELPKLKNCRLNFRRNNLKKEELGVLHNLIYHLPVNELFYENL